MIFGRPLVTGVRPRPRYEPGGRPGPKANFRMTPDGATTDRVEVFVNIDVDAVERAARFYTSALCLQVGRRFGDTAVELLGTRVNIYLLANAAGTAPFEGARERRSYDRHWTPVHLDFVVTELESWVGRARAAGARVEGNIQEHPWGRMALLSDPFGNGFCLIELTERGYDAVDAL